MLTQEEINILDKLFYEDKNYIFGFAKFFEKVKENKINIKFDKCKFYYNNQEITQLFKRKQTTIKHKIVKAKYPFEKVYVDSMYLTNANITLLNFIDFYTKVGFIFPFKLSKQLSSAKSSNCLDTVIKFAQNKGFEIKNIITDQGSEFLGAFDKLCSDNNIHHEFSRTGDKSKVAPIESFNRTVRSMYEKYKIVFKVNVTNINKVIKEINNVYNDSFHVTIKDKPNNKLNEPITDNNVKPKNEPIYKLSIGNHVRIYVRDDNKPFNKLTPLWSKEIYRVKSYDKNTGYYNVDNHLYRYNELQKVDINNLMKY